MPFEFGGEPINSGDMVIVSCAVTKGDLPLEISWLLNGKSVGDVIGITVDGSRKRVSQLTIESVSAEHAGEYTCLAKNKAGSTTFSATLNVNGIIYVVLGSLCVCFTNNNKTNPTPYSSSPFDFGVPGNSLL